MNEPAISTPTKATWIIESIDYAGQSESIDLKFYRNIIEAIKAMEVYLEFTPKIASVRLVLISKGDFDLENNSV